MTYAEEVLGGLRHHAAVYERERGRSRVGHPVTLIDGWTEGPAALAAVYTYAEFEATFGYRESDLHEYARAIEVQEPNAVAWYIYATDLEEPPPLWACRPDKHGVLWWGDLAPGEAEGEEHGVSLDLRTSAELDVAVLNARDLAAERGDEHLTLDDLKDALAGRTPNSPGGIPLAQALFQIEAAARRMLERAQDIASDRDGRMIERRDVLEALQETSEADSLHVRIDVTEWVDHPQPYPPAFKDRVTKRPGMHATYRLPNDGLGGRADEHRDEE